MGASLAYPMESSLFFCSAADSSEPPWTQLVLGFFVLCVCGAAALSPESDGLCMPPDTGTYDTGMEARRQQDLPLVQACIRHALGMHDCGGLRSDRPKNRCKPVGRAGLGGSSALWRP